jgi:hypothetical protein
MKTTAQVQQQPLTTIGLSEGFSNLQPDMLLACQIRPRHNSLHRSEWLLLWAILADALHVLSAFHPKRTKRSAKERKQFEADLAWIREEQEGTFSFAFVCDHLGLDREAVRSHIECLITSGGVFTP